MHPQWEQISFRMGATDKVGKNRQVDGGFGLFMGFVESMKNIK